MIKALSKLGLGFPVILGGHDHDLLIANHEHDEGGLVRRRCAGGVCLFIYFIVTPCADALVCICACVLCTCACARFLLRHSVHFKVIKVGSDAYKAAIIDVCWDTPEAKAPTVAMRLETVGDYEKDPIVEVRHYPTGIYVTCGPSVGGVPRPSRPPSLSHRLRVQRSWLSIRCNSRQRSLRLSSTLDHRYRFRMASSCESR